MKRHFLKLFLCALMVAIFSSCEKEELDMGLPKQIKSQVHEMIDGHRKQSYYSLWNHFRSTDRRPDGTVNDLYDPRTRYEFGKDQDNGSSAMDRYNREHSFPKSWFGATSKDDHLTMYTDLFHLYPADKESNSRRSNLPYGEIQGNAQWTNGSCKVGTMTVSGYRGLAFEPRDEIKGDLARTYFYFATRYEDEDFSEWNGSPMINKTAYPFFQGWAVKLLLKWHRQDPVDNVERNRNDAVERIQGNRNPFIDDAELAEYIWGDQKGKPYAKYQ